MHPHTRLMIGNHIADIIGDAHQRSALYHWIVQRLGSAEILYSGQERTFARAKNAAKGYLLDLAQKDRKQA